VKTARTLGRDIAPHPAEQPQKAGLNRLGQMRLKTGIDPEKITPPRNKNCEKGRRHYLKQLLKFGVNNILILRISH
jgi:hypothetical protein